MSKKEVQEEDFLFLKRQLLLAVSDMIMSTDDAGEKQERG